VAADTIRRWPKAFRTLLRYSVAGVETPEIRAYRRGGGMIGASYMSSLDRIKVDVQDVVDRYQGAIKTYQDNPDAKGAWRATKAAFHETISVLMGWIKHLNTAGESAMRMAVREAVLAAGYDETEANSAAKNATVNFDRKGEMTNFMSAMYLFFNPNVQGTTNFIDAMVNGKHKAQGYAVLGAMGTLAGLLPLLQYGDGDDGDDAWDNIGTFYKYTGMIIRTGKESFIWIPVPYGPGFINALGVAMYEKYRGKSTNGKIGMELASSFATHFSPVGNPVEEGLTSIVPFEPMKMAVQMANNKTGLGGPIMPDNKFDPSMPDKLRKWRSTQGTIWDKTTEAMSEATGGTKSQAGAIDVSPETLKFLWNSLTGGTGRFITDSGHLSWLLGNAAISGSMEGLTPEFREIPFWRGNVKELSVSDLRRRIGETRKDAEEAVADLRRAIKQEDVEGYEKRAKEGYAAKSIASVIQSNQAYVASLREQSARIMSDDTLTLAEQRIKVKALEDQEKAIYKQVFEAIGM